MSGREIAPGSAQSGSARFVIKLCGVRSAADARLCAEAGADEVGVVFARKSKRCVSLDEARAIRAALPAHVALIGVFQDAPLAELLHASRETGLAALQLHGALPAELSPLQLRAHLPLPLHRALQLHDAASLEQLAAIAPERDDREAQAPFARILLDGPRGGSGEAFPWELVRRARARWRGPFHLAGGLTPQVVAAAIRSAEPDGVDVSSGIEGSDGFKDPALVRSFVDMARAAGAELAARRAAINEWG
jgi:phosphoribosylanthranilate isomerase